MGWFWRPGGVFLMAYKNFDVPECVDNENLREIAKVVKL
jgi:hypothetical protein